MRRIPIPRILSLLVTALVAGVNTVQAQTATGNFDVTITIQADCEVTSTQTLDFGTVGVLTSNIDEQANIEITCTPGTAYNIGLDEGTGATATTTVRQMTGAGFTIDYGLFQDSGRSTNWGNSPPGDTVSDIGTGMAETHTVYGRVPPQTTPPAGSYDDNIIVTVTF